MPSPASVSITGRPKASLQNSVAPARSSVWQSMMKPARRLRWAMSLVLPGVQMRTERSALLAHHAEAMAAGRFHHPPALDELDLLRAQPDQPFGLGIDIIAFDVEVDAAFVADLLQQQDRLVAFGVQFGVFAVAIDVQRRDRLAECLAPEPRGRLEVIDLAVENEGGQAAVVAHQRVLA